MGKRHNTLSDDIFRNSKYVKALEKDSYLVDFLGEETAEKYIDAKVPLSKAQESFTRLTSGTDDAIKIIFKPEKNR